MTKVTSAARVATYLSPIFASTETVKSAAELIYKADAHRREHLAASYAMQQIKKDVSHRSEDFLEKVKNMLQVLNIHLNYAHYITFDLDKAFSFCILEK